MLLAMLSCTKQNTEVNENTPDGQAKIRAQEFWKARYGKCGDNFVTGVYRSQGRSIMLAYQYTKPKIITTSLGDLTAADKLNGIEWKGVTHISCESTRVYDCENEGADIQCKQNKHWPEWRSCENDITSNERTMTPMFIKKIKENWIINEEGKNEEKDPLIYKPIDCAKIPN